LNEVDSAFDVTEEDVAAIAAVLFSEQSKSIQENGAPVSRWVQAGRLESVEKWEQPAGLSSNWNLKERA
jgi:hypothetical protein